jgi:NAD(P)-dependent dehydrogenase (short-subunit alcohol dehydrogenase family)
LNGKIALITGADSGIGKAVAVLFAKEGADIAIAYLNEHKDARDTASIIQNIRKGVLILGSKQ